MGMNAKTSPLVILGFDAGDPNFLLRWAREGYLPMLASIMERGCWGTTAGPELLCEHGVWVSLFSGISRSRLGYYYFRQLKPGTYDLQPVTGLDLKAQPFWSGLKGRNKKVAVMDVPDVYPVPGLDGIQLSNWAPHFGWVSRHPAFAPWAEPQTLLQEARQVFGSPMDIVEKADSTLVEDRQIYRQLMERVRKKGALCRHLLSQGTFDLVVVIFTESHTAGHQFWKYRPEAQNGQTVNELTHAIRDVYQAIDAEFGALLTQLPDEASVVVASSVGMEDYYPTVGLTEAFCRQLGYQASPEPAPLSLHPLSLVRRVLPASWRVALSRFLPRDTRERLLADQFRSGTNWQKTTAFAIPAFYNGLIRVNLRGREPQGIVSPGAEYEALLDRLETDLRQLIDPQTSKPAVKAITRPGELYGGSPPDVFPDLWVQWQPARHFMERVMHPNAEIAQPRPEFFRNSDHSRSGFVAAAGPSGQGRGDLGAVEVLDLAPTFLSLLGEPIPQEMKGRVIEVMRG